MKKAISSLAALFLVVTLALPASAASISDVANPESLYPVDIILDLDNREIRKVYDLSPSADPSTLPMAWMPLADCPNLNSMAVAPHSVRPYSATPRMSSWQFTCRML